MPYPVRNAVFQWEDGARRLQAAEGRERVRLERREALILDELRRRLGSTFSGKLASEPSCTSCPASGCGSGSQTFSVRVSAGGVTTTAKSTS